MTGPRRPDDRRAVGREGEALALAYLSARGFVPIARNYRTRFGEIDLIGEMDDTLVFVEVRTRRTAAFGSGRESVTARKRAKVRRLAAAFLTERRMWSRAVRFDVVEVTLDPLSGAADIAHLPGVF
ncbi:MAG: YraN family protein [Hydrogenibacillus sp.]|nr:YraN family protein [Hydrogenibacillus sp.]